MNGADVLLLVNTGTAESPVYTAVGSQTNVKFDESVAEVDYSSKDSAATRVFGGRYGAKLSLDALYVPNDTAYQALKTAFRARTLIKVRVEEEDTETEEANALITSMSRQAPDQQACTISIGLTIDGEWSEVGS
jgi:TP901-1 family phage major tail protein